MPGDDATNDVATQKDKDDSEYSGVACQQSRKIAEDVVKVDGVDFGGGKATGKGLNIMCQSCTFTTCIGHVTIQTNLKKKNVNII